MKIYFSDVSPEVLHAVIDEAHKLRLRVTGHMAVSMSIQEFIETGADGMEHAQYLPAAEREEYDRLVKEHAHRRDTPWAMDDAVETSARLLAMEDSKQSEAVYRRMAEKQFWVTPTLTVYEHMLEQASRDYEQDGRKRYIFPPSGRRGMQNPGPARRSRDERSRWASSVSSADRTTPLPRTTPVYPCFLVPIVGPTTVIRFLGGRFTRSWRR